MHMRDLLMIAKFLVTSHELCSDVYSVKV